MCTFQQYFQTTLAASGEEIKREFAGLSVLLAKQQEQMAAMQAQIAAFTAQQTQATSAFLADQRAAIDDTKSVIASAAAQSCAIIEANKAQVAQFAEV